MRKVANGPSSSRGTCPSAGPRRSRWRWRGRELMAALLLVLALALLLAMAGRLWAAPPEERDALRAQLLIVAAAEIVLGTALAYWWGWL